MSKRYKNKKPGRTTKQSNLGEYFLRFLVLVVVLFVLLIIPIFQMDHEVAGEEFIGTITGLHQP